jgi:hypothetical protein
MSNKPIKARKVYDKDYYRAQVMLKDPWFIEKINFLKKRFSYVGCPIPKGGFKTYKQFEKWSDKYWDIRRTMINSDEYKFKINEITKGKIKISSEEYDLVEKFKDDYLPPVYGENFREILGHFDIDKDEGRFASFLESYLFFNKKEYRDTVIKTKLSRDNKKGETEMFIQIFKYTKKEDIINNWNFVVDMQKSLQGYLGKSKKWESFDRDIEIYNLYKRYKKESNHRRNNFTPIDREIFVELHKKYKEITLNQLRNVVCRAKKRLGE